MYLGHTVPDDGDIRKQVARKDGDIIRGLQECVPSDYKEENYENSSFGSGVFNISGSGNS
uniref:Uncharacterized protein n=1 Tax=Magallana gigas TaxID=29159 RepID=K1PA78_MAGGI